MSGEDPRPLSIDRRAFFWGFASLLLAGLFGYVWNIRPMLSPNDASRWNTVWSLVERGTYEIDKPIKVGEIEQYVTIDRIEIEGKSYSSKPPLLPTLIAGYVKCLQWFVREPFNRPVKDDPTKGGILLYGPATLFLFQLAPFLGFLVLYRRYLERLDADGFSWTYCVLAAGVGTYLTGYLVTLNNHVIAAVGAFASAYLLMSLWYDGRRDAWRFAAAGLCVGWTAANELPAGLLAVAALGIVFLIDVKRAILYFVPTLALVTAAFFLTNYLAIGSIKPAQLQSHLYDYPDSYWKSPDRSGIDALNDAPQTPVTYAIYVTHMTIGHHGLFSLSPIWLLSALGAWRMLRGEDRRLPGVAWPILAISAGVFIFYAFVTDQRNYGGFCHGMRWMLWLGPLWLLTLPAGVAVVAQSARGRAFAWACLLISAFSTANVMQNPWTRSWLHRIFFWFGIVDY